MFPFIFQSEILVIPSYFFMIFCAVVFSFIVLLTEKKIDDFPLKKVFYIYSGSYIFGLLGARLFFVFSHLQYYDSLLSMAALWEGGFSSFGGAFGTTVFLFVFFKFQRKRLDLWKTGDLFAPALALALSILKLGCFSVGCCYGPKTESVLGLHFITHGGTQLLPIQFFEFIAVFCLFILLRFMIIKVKKEGDKVLIFLMTYSLIKIVFLGFRADLTQSIFGFDPLLLNIFIYIGMFLIALSFLVIRHKKV